MSTGGLRIAVCATQVPFTRGGAEILVESLVDELVRRGHRCEVIRLPFSWRDRLSVLKSGVAWRTIDLMTLTGEPVDLVIATRFPAYLIRHPNKVVWLIHQFRQVYDLMGTPFSEYRDRPEDRRVAELVRGMDARGLGEARALFAISANVAGRLERYNDLEAEVLYPPPKLGDALRGGPAGDYVFAVGRLDKMKRFDLLVDAMAQAGSGVRCIIAGRGPEEAVLAEKVRRAGLEGRVELVGAVGDDELVELYAGCRAVYYAPYDEDYGYVTVEAFRAGKPVITTADAGGVLEFVEDGVSGAVCPPGSPRRIAAAIDRLAGDAETARRWGEAGRERVAGIGWERTVERLVSGTGAADQATS